MPFNRKIKTAQSIAAQTISAALQNNSSGPIESHDVLNDELEYIKVVWVGDTLLERHINRVVSTVVGAYLVHVTGAREERVAVLVERHCHDAVGQIERFLHAVAVVDVDVDVEHSRVISKLTVL